jgi:hypothetical protein
MNEPESLTGDATCDEVVQSAARDTSLSDEVFLVLRRALAGLDPLTGEKPTPVLPRRMSARGWRRRTLSRVEVGQEAGWYWRCPRRSCPTWSGPFRHEHLAFVDGDQQHRDAH